MRSKSLVKDLVYAEPFSLIMSAFNIKINKKLYDNIENRCILNE